MIKILVIKKQNNILAIEASGHSGYAESGADIVCSAISTLTQTLALGITKVLGVDAKVIVDENIPHFSLTLPTLDSKTMKDAQLLMQSTYLGIKDIANQFQKYIMVKEKIND